MADQLPPDEYVYQDYLERLLAHYYGAENVVQNCYLSHTRRYVDFLVRTPLLTFAIEVESSSDKVCSEGPTQAHLYARHYPQWTPVVIYPPDGENQEELALLSQVMPIIPVPYRPDNPVLPAPTDPE